MPLFKRTSWFLNSKSAIGFLRSLRNVSNYRCITFSTPELFSNEQACASMRSEASGDEIALLNSYNLIPNTDVGDEIVTVTNMTATALGRRP